jgi:DNA-binding NtrC family response regulator
MRKGQYVHKFDRQALMAAAKAARGNQTVMARLLGIPRTTLRVYLARMRVEHLADRYRLERLKETYTAQYGSG